MKILNSEQAPKCLKAFQQMVTHKNDFLTSKLSVLLAVMITKWSNWYHLNESKKNLFARLCDFLQFGL